MKKVINVPQGRGAILSNANSDAIEGLYTDDFSNCIIIASWNATQIALFHIDYHSNLDQIIVALAKLDHPNNRIMFKYPSPLLLEIETGLEKTQLSFSYEIIKEAIFSVFLPLQPSNDGAARLQLFDKDQLHFDIARHPNDRRLLLVRHLEEIIGLRSRAQLQLKPAVKHLYIYDHTEWVKLEEDELKPIILDETCKAEWELFQSAATLEKIKKRLYFLSRAIEGTKFKLNGEEETLSLEAEPEDIINFIAPEFEEYLKEYCAESDALEDKMQGLAITENPQKTHTDYTKLHPFWNREHIKQIKEDYKKLAEDSSTKKNRPGFTFS